MISLKRFNIKSDQILLIGAIVIASVMKGWLILSEVVPFNSDEAIVALMARHILQGERPIFFYGQAYLGSLDAWLVAFCFWLFGEGVWVIRLVQGLLYLGTIITTVKLGELALGSRRVGIVAAWILAVPTVTVSLYTTVSLGGYGEVLIFGNLILLTALRIALDIENNKQPAVWLWLVWGLLSGLGFWVFGLSLVYSIPASVLMVWAIVKSTRSRRVAYWIDVIKPIGFIVIGLVAGATPILIYAIRYGFGQLVSELSGSAIAGVEGVDWLYGIGRHVLSLLIFGTTAAFGMRPSWEFRWLALPLMPFALIFWIGVLAYIIWRLKSGENHRIGVFTLVGVLVTLALGFIFTPFGADPSGRYFLPWAIPLALFASDMLDYLKEKIARFIWGLLFLVLAYNLWGTLQSANRYPPGLTTQFDAVTQIDHQYIAYLIDFLRENGEEYGYTNYWVAYPLAYFSNEELIYVPRLPYHQDFRYTPRDDRYEPYDLEVAEAKKVAYITTNHVMLNDYLRNSFLYRGISWEEIGIGDYYIFYNLSEVVRPEDIGLGTLTVP